MNRIFIVLILCFCFCKTDAQVIEDKNKTKVFLLAGQSNMDGRAKASGLSELDKQRLKKAQRNVTLYYNFGEGKPLDTTKVAKHTAKKFGAEYLFGPELFFGIEMSEKYPDYEIVLIKRARGGMSLYGAWNPDWTIEKATLIKEEKQPKLYSELVRFSKNVLSKLEKDSYEICGMLWVQGETDSGKKGGLKPRETYQANLTSLISRVRSDFNKPNLPFLMFQVGHGKVVKAMQAVAKNDDDVVLMPQEKDKNSKFYFERNPPPIGHYKTNAMKKIGEYFFSYYQTNFATTNDLDQTYENTFRKSNLMPWAIVGFDAKERTPQERLEMLKRLGYRQYGYGHRPKHIPSMAEEWELASKMGIDVKAVWMYINLNKDKVGRLRSQNEAVFENLKKVGLKTQIWVGVDSKFFENLSDQQAMKDAVPLIAYLSLRAKSLGCKIALYNHGGWYGKPSNQLKIIEALPNEDLGIVYNFHHAHDNLNQYKYDIKLLMPYLWCVNLNGMKADGPKIMTIGDGDLEKDMILQLLELGYKGPFGILGHVKDSDPEMILKVNEKGLTNLMKTN